MAFLENMDDERIREQVRERLRVLRAEADAICDAAMQIIVTEIPRRVSFRVSGVSGDRWGDDLSELKRELTTWKADP